MFKDTNEPSIAKPYPQNIELIGMSGNIVLEPIDFRNHLLQVCGDTYPKDAIERMQIDGYDPTMVGYTHSSNREAERIQAKLDELQVQSDKPLSILLEVEPEQLRHVKRFLDMEKSFKETGLIFGEQVRFDERERMVAYRQQLHRNHGESLALWCLDVGMDVTSIEHPDVKSWINQHSLDYTEESEWGFYSSRAPREFTTAIKRDAYGLERMDEIRPDVVLTGYMHTLKYDALMSRDGHSTFYYLAQPISWEVIQNNWAAAHQDSTQHLGFKSAAAG